MVSLTHSVVLAVYPQRELVENRAAHTFITINRLEQLL